MKKHGNPSDPPDWPRFEDTLRDVLKWRDSAGTPLVVIGGIAVGVHSRPRATKDIDVSIISEESPEALLETLAEFGFAPAFKESAKLGARNGVLPIRHECGVVVDVIYARFPFEQEMVRRAEVLQLRDLKIPVVQLEDLCALKLFASRPQDLVDLQSLLRANPNADRQRVLSAVKLYAELIEEPELYAQAATALGLD